MPSPRSKSPSAPVSYELYAVHTRPGEDPGEALDRVLDEAAETTSLHGVAAGLLTSKLSPDLPVEVEAGPDHLFVTIPYLRSAEEAETVVREVFDGLAAVQTRTGWKVVDPQLDRAVDLTRDVQAVLRMLGDTIAARDEFRSG